VRHNLYTCCRCGIEERTTIKIEDAPPGWAVVSYLHIAISEEDQQKEETLITHACGNCTGEVLAFLKKASGEDIDRAFDDGGIA